MPKLLRINTRTREYAFQEMGPYAGLGGRALTSRLVRSEVPASCHPLSAENRLVAAGGMLTGTRAANSGRISVGGKSPLTRGVKESNAGGMFSQKLARLDIAGVVLEDRPGADAGLVTVRIGPDGVKFLDAGGLSGLGTYAAAGRLREEHGGKAAAMLIGPAGESCRLGASIQFTDTAGRPARAAGRGGLGALMGSKKVKAIVVDDGGTNRIRYADEGAFKTASGRWAEILKSHPVTGQGLPAFGTAILINIVNEAGALPTKNFREGRFAWAQAVSGEQMAETIKARGGKIREGCHAGCVIQCSQTYVDENGEYMSSGLEYETVWAMGPNTLIRDLDEIARLDRMCDDLGLDTIEMGNTLAMAMEAGLIPWGDGRAALELLSRAGTSDPLGKIIGNGAAFTAEALAVDRVPVVKRQSLPAYDPRAVKGVGVTYATSPMGADHTAGYAVCQNILKCGGDVNPLSKEGQVELSRGLQIATAAVDSTGLCLFVAFAVLDVADGLQTVCDMITARTGVKTGPEAFLDLGKRVLRDEYAFNEAAGFTKFQDQLPDFFKEKLPPHDVAWDFSLDELQQARA